MKKILINGLGNYFDSIEQIEYNNKEKKFIWKQNIVKKRELNIKNIKNTFKLNSLKSNKSKIDYKLWKKNDFLFLKKSNYQIKKIEKKLINLNLLNFESIDEKIKPLFLKLKIKNQYEKLINIQNSSLKNIKKIRKTLLNKHEIKETHNIIDKIFNNIFNIQYFFKPKIQFKIPIQINGKFLEQFLILESFIKKYENFNKEKLNNKFNRKNINKELFKILFKNKKEIFKYAKNKNNIILKKNSLNIFYKLFYSTFFNAFKIKKSELLLKTLEKNQDFSYNIKLKLLNVKTHLNHDKKLLIQKENYANKLNEIKEKIKELKIQKEKYKNQKKIFKNKFNNQYKILKDEKKKIFIKLKSNLVSKKAKLIEYKKYFNKIFILWKNLKINCIDLVKEKNKSSTYFNITKRELKINKKIKESELKNNILKTPIEISNTKYWTSIILGSIFPGLGSLMHKQYVKSLMHMIFTSLVLFLLMWIFGAFPTNYGNGIIGLKSLGHDPITQNEITIGITNGKANDGRFFLVMGGLAIIFLVIIIFFWIVSILENINNNNLIRIGVRQSNFKQQKNLLKSQGLPYLLSIPAMIFILFIILLPLISTILISFTNINERKWDPILKAKPSADGITTPFKWVGLKQYREIFTVMGPEFSSVLIWTLIWTFCASSLTIILGTFFAIIANQSRIKFKNLFRVIYLLPWAVPAFITIMFFSIFFQNDGIFNKVIGNTLFGFGDAKYGVDWRDDGTKTKALMIFLQSWLGSAYMFLLITGMIQSIPKSLYEAAKIDGSSKWKQFKTITAPIIISQIAPLLIGQFIFNFNNFGLIYLFNEGGPVAADKTAGEFDIFISWIYKLINSRQESKPGPASAISLIISIFTVTPSIYLFLKSKSFRKGNF